MYFFFVIVVAPCIASKSFHINRGDFQCPFLQIHFDCSDFVQTMEYIFQYKFILVKKYNLLRAPSFVLDHTDDATLSYSSHIDDRSVCCCGARNKIYFLPVYIFHCLILWCRINRTKFQCNKYRRDKRN